MRPLPQLRQQLLPVEVMTLTHAPILETRTSAWPDEAACAAFAAALAARARAARCLSSNCAASSAPARPPSCATCCARWACAGASRARPTRCWNPTRCPGWTVSHFDFYRFDDAREWEDAGFREVFAAPGLKLAEWPQKAAPLLPLPDLRLLIEAVDDDAAPRHAAGLHAARRGAAGMNAAPRRAAAHGRAGAVLRRAPAAPAAPPSSRVRVWPADDYTRVTLESDQRAERAPPAAAEPAAADDRHRRPDARPGAARTGRQGAAPTTPTSPACASARTRRAWCAWCST